MTNSNSEVNELKTLQVESEELKSRRKGSRSRKTSEANQQSEDVEEKKFSQDEAIGEQSSGTDNAVHDLAVQIEHVLKDMEEAATERPALALLSAFALGIIVGQLFSRR